MSPYTLCVTALPRAACVLLVTVVLATGVSAQTLPEPKLPPEPPPETDASTPGEEPPGSDGSAFTTSRDRWEYGLSFGVGYDSNITFRGFENLGRTEGPDSWSIFPRGRLARVFTGSSGELRLGGTASWRSYRSLESFNRYNAGLDLAGSYRASASTDWQAGASYALSYSDQSEILSDQGVLLPVVRTWTATGRLGMTRTLGQRTSLSLRGRFARVDFDEADVGARGFVDGQSLRGTAALERELGRRDSASIHYSLGANLSGRRGADAYYLTHFGSLQWNHVLSRRSGLVLEGGASYTPEAEEAGLERRVSFFGGATYSLKIRRSRLMLFLRREVTPAFGLGVERVQTRLGISAAFQLGRAWALNLRGTRNAFESPEENAIPYSTSDEVSANLSRSLGRHFGVSAEGRYRRRGATGAFPAVDAYYAGLVVSIGGG